MFNWLKNKRKKPDSGRIIRKRQVTPSQPAKDTNTTGKLKRLGVLKQSEHETVRAIRKYIRDNPKRATQLIQLWLELAEQNKSKSIKRDK